MNWFKRKNIIIVNNEPEKQILEWINYIKEKYDCYAEFDYEYLGYEIRYTIYTDVTQFHSSNNIENILKILSNLEKIIETNNKIKEV